MADDKLLIVEIVTPKEILYSGKAESVSVPGSQSPFQVLYNHAPIVSSLDPGIINIAENGNKVKLFVTTSGFVEVLKNKVSILVEKATDAEKISIPAVQEELKLAEDLLAAAKDPDEIGLQKRLISEAQLKIKAAKQK